MQNSNSGFKRVPWIPTILYFRCVFACIQGIGTILLKVRIYLRKVCCCMFYVLVAILDFGLTLLIIFMLILVLGRCVPLTVSSVQKVLFVVSSIWKVLTISDEFWLFWTLTTIIIVISFCRSAPFFILFAHTKTRVLFLFRTLAAGFTTNRVFFRRSFSCWPWWFAAFHIKWKKIFLKFRQKWLQSRYKKSEFSVICNVIYNLSNIVSFTKNRQAGIPTLVIHYINAISITPKFVAKYINYQRRLMARHWNKPQFLKSWVNVLPSPHYNSTLKNTL